MNTQPVSFGKTIKVNSSLRNAEIISMSVNGKYTGYISYISSLAAKCLFDDTNTCEAITVTLGENGGNYILSGHEAKIAKQLHSRLLNSLDFSHRFFESDIISKIASKVAINEYGNNLKRLIYLTEEPYSLDVKMDNLNEKIDSITVNFKA